MSELSLSQDLMDKIQAVLVENDPEAEDKVTQAQYLSALMGFVVTEITAPQDKLAGLMEQLCAFSTHVFDEEMKKKQPISAPPAQDAFGIWRP